MIIQYESKKCEQTIENLQENEINFEELLADTGYSSGEALQYLGNRNINALYKNTN